MQKESHPVVLSPFEEVRWYRLRAQLRNLQAAPTMPPTYLVMQALLKRVASQMSERYTPPQVVFHLPNRSIGFKAKQGEIFPVHIHLFCDQLDSLYEWLRAFIHALVAQADETHHTLQDAPTIDERSFERLQRDYAHLPSEGELCLEFLTPLPFRPTPGYDRTYLDKAQFIRLLERRLQRLFGKPLVYQSDEDDFRLLSCYWHYMEVRRASTSQAGIEHHLKGCAGALYLKGRFRDFLPFLILGAEVHAGGQLSYGLGYYRIVADSAPYFRRRYPSAALIGRALQEVRERYDLDSSEEAALAERSETEWVNSLCDALRTGHYQPSPSRAFIVPKPAGGTRVVEQLELPDLIVHISLLRLLEEPFDRLLEPSTLGYRKGRSREHAVQQVRDALAEGYQYVIETDIEDFFPSVQHERLEQLLDAVLPAADAPIRDLIMRCVRTPYRWQDPKQGDTVQERRQGLPQGSPLSPLLANLYLDSFDEQLRAWGVRLIRYGDDLLVLTRTREEAEQVLNRMQDALVPLGLRLKPEKTAIKAITEGFQFLGIAFRGDEMVVLPEPEPYRLKKPLYVTEPYLYLGVRGDQLCLMRQGKVIQSFPLTRLSEIVLMEPATLSTRLIHKCTQLQIPLSLTLGSGYSITTIKPDSQAYHTLSYQHAARYYALSESERLAIAQAIVDAKLHNYLTLFRQRYQRGDAAVLHQLEAYRQQIGAASDLDALRGLEGSAARLIYRHLNRFLHEPAFQLTERVRRPPDPINSLLNLGYYLLFSRLNALVRAMGLNPYLGFLHSPHDRFESLIADLQEPFRAQIDRIVVKFVNLRIITLEDFEQTERGAYLTRAAKKRFLEHYERELCRTYRPHQHSLLEHLSQQVRVIKQWASEGTSLTFYRWEP